MSDYDKIANLEEVIAAKDEEIEKLNEKLTLHDCWADEECEDAAASRTRGELENEELRTLVKELVDVLEKAENKFGSIRGEYQRKYIQRKYHALVARAREVTK